MTAPLRYPTEFATRRIAFETAATFAMARLRVRPIGEVVFDCRPDENAIVLSIVGKVETPEGSIGRYGSTVRFASIFPGGLADGGDLFAAFGISIAEADFGATVDRLAESVSAFAERSAGWRSPVERPIPPETPYSFAAPAE